MKIVSLLPSATEIICLLGLRDQLVGVTHECDFPNGVQTLPSVTRSFIPADATSHEIDAAVRAQVQSQLALYSLDVEKLEELQPDLIVTQALCDVCAVSEEEVRSAACALPTNPNVVNLEPMSLEEVFESILIVGRAANCEQRAEQEVEQLRTRVDNVVSRSQEIVDRPKVAFLEWIDPLFCGGHWNPELVRLAGGDDCIGTAGTVSRTVAWDDIAAADPDVLFIACCGFDIDRAKQDLSILKNSPGWDDLKSVQQKRVYLADGSAYFNRPGPRLVDSLELLAHALHPNVHPLPENLTACECVVD